MISFDYPAISGYKCPECKVVYQKPQTCPQCKHFTKPVFEELPPE